MKKEPGNNDKFFTDLDARFLGRMMKYRREARKLTQQEAADQIGLAFSTYKKLETGYNNVSVPSLYSALYFYNLSADSIFFPTMEDSNNTTLKQIHRLLTRCSDSELELILTLVSGVLATTDKIPSDNTKETIEESYKKAFSETMDIHKSNRS